MLVLTRRQDEKIRLPILGIRNNQVRIGIDAPADVSIFREEIYKKAQAESITEKNSKTLATKIEGNTTKAA